MIARDPSLREFAGGMPGGPENPLGARALYLYQGNRDTLYRLHGTNEPWSIGQAVSSGCIRLINQDIIDLHDRVAIGTRVQVIG
jgi:lipoprotein-anchoring transpeptidase ErfK/SrfK